MNIQKASALLIGTGPYSQGKYVSNREHPKKKSESSRDWDTKIREHKAHYNEKDEIVIPAMALKNMFTAVTKQNNRFVKGESGAKWASIFKTGVLVIASPTLLKPDGSPWTRDNMTFEDMLVGPGDGKKDMFWFPTFRQWKSEVEWVITDSRITKEAFSEYLEESGIITGLGRFRVGRGGLYGGFTVEQFAWK
jgi:hypothetical protein